MQGQFFVHIGPDPRTPGRMLIKTGVVAAVLGGDHLLLEFQANGYRFKNVLAPELLKSFAFFDTAEERQAFIDELMASGAPTEPPRSEPQTPPEDSAESPGF